MTWQYFVALLFPCAAVPGDSLHKWPLIPSCGPCCECDETFERTVEWPVKGDALTLGVTSIMKGCHRQKSAITAIHSVALLEYDQFSRKYSKQTSRTRPLEPIYYTTIFSKIQKPWAWWRHQMETFSALLAICAGNSPVAGEFPHKGQWRGALMSSLICTWINGWVNNGDAGDLRRHRAHYDVPVMRARLHTIRVTIIGSRQYLSYGVLV